MTLTDRRDVQTILIALLVVILVDDGDDLLRRKVIDIRIAGHIKRTRLSGCKTVDDEVGLLIDKIRIVGFCNDDSCRYTGRVGSAIAYTVDTGDSTGLITGIKVGINSITFPTVIVSAGCRESQFFHLFLFYIIKTVIGLLINDLTRSIRRITKDNGFHCHVILSCLRHGDGRIVMSFIGQTLILLTANDIVRVNGL